MKIRYGPKALTQQSHSAPTALQPPREGLDRTDATVIHRTAADACQGIELRANAGTVAAIADFGPYCYDGEPAAESVAAFGTDSLTEWDIDVTKDFDDWERVSDAGGSAYAIGCNSGGNQLWKLGLVTAKSAG